LVFLSSFRGKRDIFRNFTPEIGKKYMKKLVYLALIAVALAACSTPGKGSIDKGLFANVSP